MSSSKLDSSGILESSPVSRKADSTFKAVLDLPAHVVHLRKSGIEFISPDPIAAWTELTLQILASKGSRKIVCNGIVVGCHGNRKSGFVVSLIFFNLSRQSQQRLSELVGG